MSLEEIKIQLDTLRAERDKIAVQVKYWANRYNVLKFRSKEKWLK